MSKDSTDYIGDFIYHNNKFSKYNWGNGYIVPTGSSSGYAYRFYFRDHQGNNRVVTTSTGTVKQTTHYYPDGVTHDKSTGQGEQVYKYNGKELDRPVREWINKEVDQRADSIFSYTTYEDARLCVDLLKASPAFVAENTRMHNSMSAALNKYLLFIEERERRQNKINQ